MREEFTSKRRWYSSEGNGSDVGCVNSVSGCLVVKFSRQPTEETLEEARAKPRQPVNR